MNSEVLKLNLQEGFGMMRRCELITIAMIAEAIGAVGYVSLGCGDAHEARLIPHVPCLGFDVKPDPHLPHLEFHQFSILGNETPIESRVLTTIQDFRARAPLGRFLFYTDNGNKLAELRGLLPLLKSGDVIGTHDWGVDDVTVANTATEVREDQCGFLYAAGLTLYSYEGFEEWIREHRCIQRFWQK